MSDLPSDYIYLDHNATTPVAPEVSEAMTPYITERFGNPSSDYPLGIQAKEAVEKARGQVADLLGAKPERIIFTSGGTESNNMVLKGVVDFRSPEKTHIITCAVEHPAILNPLIYLMELGVQVTVLGVDHHGQVDPQDVEKAIRPETKLITIMLANNETGTLQPVKEICDVASKHGVPVHTDAAQAVGKIEVDVDELGVDFLSVAGHKLYAPKGVGALYIRKGRGLTPLVHGASQEKGMRPGTENVILAVGLGAACELCAKRLPKDMKRTRELRDRLQDLLFDALEEVVLNGHPENRLPNTLNVSVPGLQGSSILGGVPRIMASTGAACHEKSIKISHVLSAMGVPEDVAIGALRLTVGRSNTMEQIEDAARLLISRIREMKDDRN